MDACIDHGRAGIGFGPRKVAGRARLIHRLVYAEANGLDEAAMGGAVMHTCDNARCISIRHLVFGTQGDNVRDMVAKGRNYTCEALTIEQIREVRAEHVPRCRQHGCRAIARRLGVSHVLISKAVRGVTYKEVACG